MLLHELLADPRSRVMAAVAGWSYPVSREWQLLAMLHDVTVSTTPGVTYPERYHLPRPWKLAGRPKRKPRSVAELRSVLKPWESVASGGA